jgi:hypothetical protein
MPLINATWRVTHDSVVLLDWDDFMQSEPEIDRAFAVDQFAALSGSGVSRTHFSRHNLFHTVAFSRVRVFENDDEAREFMRAHTILLSDERSNCLIEWLRQGVSNTLAGAVITTYRAHVENNHFMADYALQGGALT